MQCPGGAGGRRRREWAQGGHEPARHWGRNTGTESQTPSAGVPTKHQPKEEVLPARGPPLPLAGGRPSGSSLPALPLLPSLCHIARKATKAAALGVPPPSPPPPQTCSSPEAAPEAGSSRPRPPAARPPWGRASAGGPAGGPCTTAFGPPGLQEHQAGRGGQLEAERRALQERHHSFALRCVRVCVRVREGGTG